MAQSEALYRTMAETASDAFLTIDQNSTILFVNAAAEQTFGYRANEMIGQKLTMLMPQEMRGMHLAGIDRYLAAGRKGISWRGVELPGRHKDGRLFPLEISIGEFVRNGEHIFTGIARDISERKQTEMILAQHFCVIESSNDAIYSKTLEGIVTSWNQAAESLFGYSAAEIIGKDVGLLLPPDRVQEEGEILGRVGRGERIWRCHARRLPWRSLSPSQRRPRASVQSGGQ
jgi:PAS domain S-box-containing protein